jgi:AraC-like DNA-binding protein
MMDYFPIFNLFKSQRAGYIGTMDDKRKGSGFDNEHYFTIPADFLAEFAGNPLSEFLVVTDIGQFPRAKHHYCGRNKGIDAAIFIYCCEGSGIYSINGNENRVINPGQMLIIPPGAPHRYAASDNDPWSIFWMHVKGRYFDTFYRNWPSPGSSVLPELIPVSDMFGGRIREIFYQCFYILKMPYQWEEFLYLCQLAATVISLIPGAFKQSSSGLSVNGSRGIESAILYMKNHLHESVTLENLAQAACFSPSHLHYLFRKSFDYAPVDYFLRMKIQAAAKDIFFTDLTIREIAEAYGIDDPYYFSRLFKKVIGLSPLQYRRSHHLN